MAYCVLWFYFNQGPPGTGKSFVGVALVHLLLSMNVPQNHGPILVRYRLAECTNNLLCKCSKEQNCFNMDVQLVVIFFPVDPT